MINLHKFKEDLNQPSPCRISSPSFWCLLIQAHTVIEAETMNDFHQSFIVAVICVVGFFVYQRINKKLQRSFPGHVDSLNKSTVIQEELSFNEKNPISCSRVSLISTGSCASGIVTSRYETDDEMYSACGSEPNDYFDLTTDDEFSEELLKENGDSVKKENSCNLFEEVDLLFEGNKEDLLSALTLLKQEENQYCENADFFWRMAKYYYLQAKAFGTENIDEEQKEYVLQGLPYAEKALAIDPSNSNAHKYYGILVGMKGQFLCVQEQIKSGLLFEKHLNESLKGNPHDPAVHHLLGRFKYRIANLSWFQRTMAATFYPDLPTFTMDDALENFQQAEKLNEKPWKENKLFVSKCYIGSGEYVEAYKWLKLTKDVDPITEEDRLCDEECNSLITVYKSYVDTDN